MEFGRVSPDELNKLNFTFPADPLQNKTFLAQQGSPEAPTRFYVGCAKWGRADWVGKLYPPGTREADFLKYYAKQFRTIELNATYYRVPAPSVIDRWRKAAGEGFVFCPKFPKSITHDLQLSNCAKETDEFVRSLYHFKKNLGPVFLLLPPLFAADRLEQLNAYLSTLPKDIRFFVEARHPSWFSDTASQELFDVLTDKHCGAVITDAAGRRDCLHMRLTVPAAFIRFVGNALHPTDYKRVDDWVQQIKTWSNNGLSEMYFFMHQHNELHSPELCAYTIRQLNQFIPEPLTVPQFIKNESTLF
jgi:uncharacterized protein YecE (DUF72 family)